MLLNLIQTKKIKDKGKHYIQKDKMSGGGSCG